MIRALDVKFAVSAKLIGRPAWLLSAIKRWAKNHHLCAADAGTDILAAESASISSNGILAKSTEARTFERGTSRSATGMRDHDQFQHADIGEVDLVFLGLADGVGWAEVPLLAHNFSK
jgi:hypothetical protein